MDNQKEFLEYIAHELRTPLAIIKANLEVTLLNSENLTKNELIKAAKDTILEVDHLTKIIESFSSASSGGVLPSRNTDQK